MVKKILIGVFALFFIVVLGVVVFVFSTYDRDYSEQYPVSDLKVEADSAMIERGRYLVYGPAHCMDCHSPMEQVVKNEDNSELPLSGGFGLQIPPGIFYAPNITPDKETGIGNYSDGELYRMMRHNITRSGQATIDFMPFINMANEDIYSIIAFLKSQKPVKNKMPETEFSFLGKMLLAFGAIKSGEPDKPILDKVVPDSSVEYGKYLAYSVANCRGCHTDRDLKSGEFIGDDYAGGMIFGPDDFTKGWVYVTPNLTPHSESGVMSDWSEDDFIERMRGGKGYETSPMPWVPFAKMSDNDLKAIYRFLISLKPVNNEITKVAISPEEK
ncbi:MAG: cytochrome C [Calditrichaeota bacterium]|nr:MAG: cytochrome C [Calditrichota bacterium]MBL1203870.1 cytochrome C [Calditrichota bacterium]NOG43702.1 cytochrome C [Calditrichota bacterium]